MTQATLMIFGGALTLYYGLIVREMLRVSADMKRQMIDAVRSDALPRLRLVGR